MKLKYPLILAAALTLSASALAGCSKSAPKDISLESAPIVVVSEPTPAIGPAAHAHNCSSPDTLCGTITNGVFQDSQRNFQLPVPEAWEIRGQELTDDSMIIGSPSDHSFLEIRRQDSDPNLFAYTQDDFQKSYETGVTDFHIATFEKVTVQNLSAVHLVYSCTDNGVPYHFNQYIIAGNFDYNITLIQRSEETDRSAEFAQLIQNFQQLSSAAPQSNNGKLIDRLYTAPDGSYSITLPEGWRLDASQEHFSAQSADHTAALNLLVNAPDSTLLDSTKEQVQEYYAKMFSNAQISLFEKTSIAGVSSLHLVCSYQSDGKTICAEQFLIPTASHTYTLTFTKAATATDPVFASTAKTFTLRT